MITYEPLWKTLKQKGISTYALIVKHNVSKGTIYRLRHGQGITLHTVEYLCEILDCNIEDIVQYKKELD